MIEAKNNTGMNGTVKSVAGWKSSKNLITVLLGIISGIVLIIAASEDKKWFAAAALGLISLFSLFVVTRNFRQFFVLLAVFALPIRLDFHPIFKVTNFAQLKGLPITLFDVAFALLFVYWVLQLLVRRETFRFFATISIPALAYILLAGISAFLSQDKVLSFSMLLLIVKSYLVFLYFANNIRTKEEILWIVGVLSFSILLQSIVSIIQYFSGSTLGLEIFGEGERAFRTAKVGFSYISRVGGTIGDPNSLAMYLNFFLPVLFCFIFINIDLRLKFLVCICMLMGGLSELMTLSRGGWIALCFGVMVAFYGIFKEKLKSRLKSVVAVVMSVFFVAIVTLGLFQDVRDRLFEDDYGAAYSRIPMMEVAFNVIKGNPFTGVGLNNYTTVMNRYDRTREEISYKFPFPVHNAFLIIAAESGLLALFCFLMVLLATFKKALEFFYGKNRFLCFLGIGWFCGILTWMAHAQFKMDFAGINIVLWFSLGMITAMHRMLFLSESAPAHQTKQ